MWSANHDAREAGLGHRRQRPTRSLPTPEQPSNRAEAAIAAIHADGAPVKQHLDQLQRHAADLRGRAEPSRRARHPRPPARSGSSTRSSTPPTPTPRWLEGRPTPTARLAHAVDTLTAVARQRTLVCDGTTGEIDQTQWYQLLDLAPRHQLEQERSAPEFQLGR